MFSREGQKKKKPQTGYSTNKWGNKKDRENLVYHTLKVKRPLSDEEKQYLKSIEDEGLRMWETERLSLLFQISVLGEDASNASGRLRNMLSSSELVIEGVDANNLRTLDVPTETQIGAALGYVKTEKEVSPPEPEN